MPKLNVHKNETKKEKNSSGIKKGRAIALLVLVFIISAFLLAINFLTDWLWFSEVGYVSVFITKIVTQLKYGVPIALVLALLMALYLHGLKRGYFKRIVSKEETNLKKLNLYTNLISIAFGIFIAVYFVQHMWFEFLAFINSTNVGKSDPLFGMDISFYLFKYEFLNKLNDLLLGVVGLFFGATLLYYMILMVMHSPDVYEEDEAIPIDRGKPGLNNDGTYGASDSNETKNAGTSAGASEGESASSGGGSWNGFGGNDFKQSPFKNIFDSLNKGGIKKPKIKTPPKQVSKTNMNTLLNLGSWQLILLAVIFFIMIGINFLLLQFELLQGHTGIVYGAGYTDIKVTLLVYRILIGLSVIGAIASAYFIAKKKFMRLVIVPAVMIAVFLLGQGAASLVQSMIVSPDEINKESKYLADNIEYTQYAYGIDNVDVRDFAANSSLNADAINANDETISNVRINDFEPVQTFYNQTQSIRQYYTFNDTDVDRYVLDGDYTQTYLSVREIDEKKINDTWINRHIKYTHGYGIAVSRVDTITSSGQPDILVKDIPPTTDAKELEVTRPEIYFGESTDDYIIVGTNEEEFDYPDGQENRYTRYEGTAGIRLTPINRLMFAIKEGSMKLLVSTNVNSNSRIIINREITHRVAKIMPFLAYEYDPYAVVEDGKIYWIIDAYTQSEYYPYSEPYSGVVGSTNYIRNSVKVVIDAYNGTVDFYVVDPDDAIALTYQKIFPKLFKDFDQMPEKLRAHIRYPHTLFQIQADVYGRYHMDDVKVFYQDEDNWDVAHEIYGMDEAKIRSNFFVLKLPGETSAEFVSTLPYSPKGKQNMTALLLNRNDGEHYGELVLYRFPKSKTVYGPMQIEAQINQNTKISQDFSLWSNAGTAYSRGNLFVIPVEDSLLYVEPIYLNASNTAIPEVKRIIVAYGDRIAYEPTLKEALISLFGSGVDSDSPGSSGQGSGSGNGSGSSSGSGNSSGTSSSSGSGYSGGIAGSGTLEEQNALIGQAAEAYDKAQSALADGDWVSYGQYMAQLQDALDALSENAGIVKDAEAMTGTADMMQPLENLEDASSANAESSANAVTDATADANDASADEKSEDSKEG